MKNLPRYSTTVASLLASSQGPASYPHLLKFPRIKGVILLRIGELVVDRQYQILFLVGEQDLRQNVWVEIFPFLGHCLMPARLQKNQEMQEQNHRLAYGKGETKWGRRGAFTKHRRQIPAR